MAVPGVVIAKVAATLLSNEKSRKAIGWIMVAVFSPLILIAAFLCSAASGGADHNNQTVEASFYGTSYTESIPAEFRTHISEMQEAFTKLDTAIGNANASGQEGGGLDPIQVKAIFYALCFGEQAPNRREARQFVACFFGEEARTNTVVTEADDGSVTVTEETNTVVVPLSLESAYEKLAVLLGREVTQEDKDNAAHIYTMIAGSVIGSSYDGPISYGGSYSGSIESSGNHNTEIDISGFTDPDTKNANDLVAYALQAWEAGWGYVWGTFGGILTESAFQSKLEQYPDALSGNEDFIWVNWVGGRTSDCVGLIKGYGWLDTENMSFVYASNGMPDITANQMYHNATESGEIGTIPEIPGLAVWHDGHIGVYIGGGFVIEAMGTHYGVVRTELEGRGWTHWLKIPYIDYDTADSWRDLLIRHQQVMADASRIQSKDLKWYAAFHDEGTHPHIHLMFWSTGENDGYLSSEGVQKMRSVMTNDIFQNEMTELYQRKDRSYKEVSETAKLRMSELVAQMRSQIGTSPVIEQRMVELAQQLETVTGKKQYAYLKKPLKKLVDELVDELAKEPSVAQCYAAWNEIRDELEGYYKTTQREHLPLSKQKEFRAIKNLVIREADNLRTGALTYEEDWSEGSYADPGYPEYRAAKLQLQTAVVVYYHQGVGCYDGKTVEPETGRSQDRGCDQCD